MARRYINTSKYNPYSFQEMWQPALAATQAHQQQMGALAQMESQNAMLGSFLDPEIDAVEYQRWQDYTNRIQQISRDFMARGLSSGTYNNIYNATIDYSRNIQPIATGIQNRANFINQINQTLTEHPDFVAKTDLMQPVSNYIKGNPQVELISGLQIQNDMATLAEAYSKNIGSITTESFSKLRDIIKTTTGLDFQQLQLQMNDPESDLAKLKQAVLLKHGVIDSDGQTVLKNQDYQKLNNYANMGMYGALGTTQRSIQQNDVADLAQLNMQQAQLQMQREDRNQKRIESAINLGMALGDYDTAAQIYNVDLSSYNLTGSNNSSLDAGPQIPSDVYAVTNPQWNNEGADFNTAFGRSKITKAQVRNVANAINTVTQNGTRTKNIGNLTNTQTYKNLPLKERQYLNYIAKKHNIDITKLDVQTAQKLHTVFQGYNNANAALAYYQWSNPDNLTQKELNNGINRINAAANLQIQPLKNGEGMYFENDVTDFNNIKLTINRNNGKKKDTETFTIPIVNLMQQFSDQGAFNRVQLKQLQDDYARLQQNATRGIYNKSLQDRYASNASSLVSAVANNYFYK